MTLQNTSFTQQAGNATIYVLILVALFAALSFTLMRQNDSSESATLEGEKAEIIASQIIAYPFQVKQAIEMMTMTGSEASDLDFMLPDDVNFNVAPTGNKVFHPGGGGLNLARLPEEGIVGTTPAFTDPPAGWYLGMFNNVEWSLTAAPDVMLVAFQLSQQVCEKINERLTGSATIPTPALGNTIPNIFIDTDNPPGTPVHTGSNVAELNVGLCTACEDIPALCVEDSAGRYGFYSMIINN